MTIYGNTLFVDQVRIQHFIDSNGIVKDSPEYVFLNQLLTIEKGTYNEFIFGLIGNSFNTPVILPKYTLLEAMNALPVVNTKNVKDFIVQKSIDGSDVLIKKNEILNILNIIDLDKDKGGSLWSGVYSFENKNYAFLKMKDYYLKRFMSVSDFTIEYNLLFENILNSDARTIASYNFYNEQYRLSIEENTIFQDKLLELLGRFDPTTKALKIFESNSSIYDPPKDIEVIGVVYSNMSWLYNMIIQLQFSSPFLVKPVSNNDELQANNVFGFVLRDLHKTTMSNYAEFRNFAIYYATVLAHNVYLLDMNEPSDVDEFKDFAQDVLNDISISLNSITSSKILNFNKMVNTQLILSTILKNNYTTFDPNWILPKDFVDYATMRLHISNFIYTFDLLKDLLSISRQVSTEIIEV